MSIKTLSPHYVAIPLTNPLTGTVCSSYEMRLYIWEGSKTAVPAQPAYTMTKINAAGAPGTDKVNIARIVNDFIEFACVPQAGTVLADGNNQVWVKHVCYYDDAPQTPAHQEVNLAVKGYGYFAEGENPQLPANKVLLSGDEFKVSRNGRFVFPVMVDEPPVPERVLVVQDFVRTSGIKYTATVTANFPYNDSALFVRPVGSTEWVAAGSAAAPVVPATIAAHVFEVMATAFDPVTSTIIESNIFTITALKIYLVDPGDNGHSIAVFFQANIHAANYGLEIFGLSGPGWTNVFSQPNSPLPHSFTPTGAFKARVTANGHYSNEASFSIPLAGNLYIP
ncbi:hypothetical protein OGH69_16645 [Flavobacterium sp. MFBS3-15]|uniref:hypothetical protein n=1 Tax=Flavobacterium sp. MFBS3-15 TaxID=2989816 RepID=UPI002235B0E5|nr:hypothetical protein [Flavobacterium sp. MFBS3-15]MCW4470602.1 hypothetical protein [Flavobacterium sp. MFBS3-15]